MDEATGVEAKAGGNADLFAEAHRQLRADPAIQFDLQPFVPPTPPAWLKAFGEFLAAIMPLLQLLFWIAVALAALFLFVMLARRVQDGEWSWRRRARPEPARESWQPEEAPARALLSEADALAAAGRYAEAAHLLLYRSIEDIDRRRPALVRPALTSRDIAVAPVLPPGPKRSFGEIVMMVERSLFGGRALDEGDWRVCRDAYRDFAFASAWKD